MGPVETLLAWDQLARHNVNQRAVELSLGHLIHIGDRVIKLAPKAVVPVVKKVASKGPANWVAATRLAGLVSPVIIGKRLFTPIIAPIPKVIVTSLITAPNALFVAAAGVGVERLVQGLAARAFRAAAAATRPPRGDFEEPDLRKGDMLRELPCLRCLRGNSASAITVMVFLFL